MTNKLTSFSHKEIFESVFGREPKNITELLKKLARMEELASELRQVLISVPEIGYQPLDGETLAEQLSSLESVISIITTVVSPYALLDISDLMVEKLDKDRKYERGGKIPF